MGVFSKLTERFDETDDQREERLYREEKQQKTYTGSSVFVIDDVFYIRGRGTVVTGKVTEGEFSVGDKVRIDLSDGNTWESGITGLELFRKMVNTVHEDENCGILLSGIGMEQLGIEKERLHSGNLIIK